MLPSGFQKCIDDAALKLSTADFVAWRHRMGWNKAEASRRLGLSRNSYVAYETGLKPVPLYVRLAAAALAFGLPPIP